MLFLLALMVGLIGYKKCGKLLFTVGVVVLVVSSSPFTANYLTNYLEGQYPPLPVEESQNADLIVVLGGAIDMPTHPRISVELVNSSDRVLHAFRLYRAGKAPVIFLSAGNFFDYRVDKPEADYIQSLLMEWGVPEISIIASGNSRSTRENALEVQSYLEANSITGQSILLVTSAKHMPRAMQVFTRLGINVIPSSTDISSAAPSNIGILSKLPSLGAMNSVTSSWHEILGIWYYRLRGWI